MTLQINDSRKISFEYEGEHYTTSMAAYSKSGIVLPDGRLLRVTLWLESLPPQVGGAVEENHVLDKDDVSAIAEFFNAEVATLEEK